MFIRNFIKEYLNKKNCKKFISAIRHHHDEKKANELLNKITDVNQAVGLGYSSLLIHTVIRNCHLSIIQKIIQKKANINFQDGCGDTALHWAVRVKRLDLIEELVKNKNINVHLINCFGHTVLMGAFSNPSDYDPVFTASTIKMICKYISTKDQSQLIDYNFDDNSTIIHSAILYEDMKSFKILINAGAKVQYIKSIVDLLTNQNPREITVELFEILKLYISYATPFGIDESNLLMWAIGSKMHELVEIIVKKGAKLNKIGNEKVIRDYKDPLLFELLVRYGAATIDEKDFYDCFYKNQDDIEQYIQLNPTDFIQSNDRVQKLTHVIAGHAVILLLFKIDSETAIIVRNRLERYQPLVKAYQKEMQNIIDIARTGKSDPFPTDLTSEILEYCGLFKLKPKQKWIQEVTKSLQR